MNEQNLDEMRMQGLNARFNGGNMKEFFDAIPDVKRLMEFAEWRKAQPDEKMKVNRKDNLSDDKEAIILSPELEDEFAVNLSRSMRIFGCLIVTGVSPYFNESRYFNSGIKAALEQPRIKWIIIACDDIKALESFEVLNQRLNGISNTEFDCVWVNPRPDYYHSYDCYLAKPSGTEDFIKTLAGQDNLSELRTKFKVENIVVPQVPIRKPFRYWLFHKLHPSWMYDRSLKFRMTSDFCILSAEWCRKNMPVFNELFVGNQDIDLSLRLMKARSTTIDFKIGSEIGGHYKPSMVKSQREVFNLAILNELMRRGNYK